MSDLPQSASPIHEALLSAQLAEVALREGRTVDAAGQLAACITRIRQAIATGATR